MHKSLFVPLTVMLLIASSFALSQAAALHAPPAIAVDSPSVLATVRGYYAAVDLYLETGDMRGIRAIVDPSLSGTEDPASDGGIEPYLRSLRQTYPQLTMTVMDMHQENSVVIAQLAVDAGAPTHLNRIDSQPLRQWQMTETFTVADGKIASRWSSGPGLGLLASLPGFPIDKSLYRKHSVVLSRIIFQASSSDYLAIPAPALLIVERGTLPTQGNGVTMLSSADDTAGAVTAPGIEYVLQSGDALVVPAGRAVLRNTGGQPASLVAALFLPADPGVREDEHGSHATLFLEALNAPDGGTAGDGISVHTIARSTRAVGPGTVRLMSGFAVLTPGGSMTVEDAAMEALIAPLAGNPSIERDARDGGRTVWNAAAEQTVAWVVQIDEDERIS